MAKLKRHNFAAGFSVGIVIIAAVLFFAGFGLYKIFKPDLMMNPDGIITDPDAPTAPTGQIPYSEPALANLEVGKALMDGFLSLVASHDIPDFEDANLLPGDILISVGVWLALSDASLAPEFEMSAEGEMIIPAETVKTLMKTRFNRTEPVADQTVMIYGYFTYDEEKKSYIVPVYGMDAAYIARVKELEPLPEDAGYNITMEYLDLQEYFETDPERTEGLEAKKTVILTVSADNPYRLLSLTTI